MIPLVILQRCCIAVFGYPEAKFLSSFLVNLYFQEWVVKLDSFLKCIAFSLSWKKHSADMQTQFLFNRFLLSSFGMFQFRNDCNLIFNIWKIVFDHVFYPLHRIIFCEVYYHITFWLGICNLYFESSIS